MENETEVIRQQMLDTRTALTEKLEAVEELVASTVKETTQTVSDTVEAVTDKVENTVTAVTDTVSESVQSVKQALDISGYVEQYPWLVMGGGVALGYVLGSMLGSSRDTADRSSWSTASPHEVERALPPASSGGTTFAETARSEESSGNGRQTSSFLDSWAPAIDKLKGLAISAAMGVVGEMVMKNIPDSLKSDVTNFLDETTRTMGGTYHHDQPE